ncbi:MAG: hypothetical protein IPH54_20075 [Rhodoferax sp.]|jgi:hypothetical protein|nr:hypothetical protein [Rhodoferax sp.]
MTDNLDQLAGQMVALFRQAVPLANLEVDAIIQSGEQDTQRIEHQLDHMLGLCCDPDMLVVFKRLCRYYDGPKRRNLGSSHRRKEREREFRGLPLNFTLTHVTHATHTL